MPEEQQELDLGFVRMHARRGDYLTSVEAAEAIHRSGEASRQARLVFSCLVQMPNHQGTNKEIADMFSINYHMVARRIPDLRKIGMVKALDEKRNGCMVWEAIIG